MPEIKNLIKFFIFSFIIFTFLTSLFGFVYMETYNRNEIAKYNSEKMNWNDFCSNQNPPGGISFYKKVFPFIFTLIEVSAILVLIMFGFILLKTFFYDRRAFMELAIFTMLVLFIIWSFFFVSFYSIKPTLLAFILAILIFARIKIPSYDKYTIVVSVFFVALSYFILLGAWFDTDPQFYNCIGFLN